MKYSVGSVPKGGVLFSDRLVVFAFFLAGAALFFFYSDSFLTALSPRAVLCVLMGLVLLSSASLMGSVLLPVCSFACGAYCEQTALAWLESGSNGMREARILYGSAILVPIFFLCAVYGMAISGSVYTLLHCGSPSARRFFRRDLLSLLFFAVLGFAAIFFFT